MSSALDAASLVMIPSGYEDGTLGSLKPTDGSGDFTFSRGSNLSATRINEQGYIEKGYENLLLQSNTFSDAAWTKTTTSVTSGQSGYDGSSDAWLLTATTTLNAYMQKTGSFSGVNTFSIYAKANTSSFFVLFDSANPYVYFDLGNGTIGTQVSNPIDAKITSVGNGWHRCSITTNNPNNLRIYIVDADGSTAVTNGNSIYIQDAMLNQGLVAYPYIETTTAPVAGGILEDMPRLDWSGSCPSLLLEPSRTNALSHSEFIQGLNFSIGDFISSPEGVANGVGFIPSSSNTTHYISAATGGLTIANSSVVFSFYVKQGTQPYLRGRFDENSFTKRCFFGIDLTDNSVLKSGTGASSVEITFEDSVDGWKKVIFTATYDATPTGTGLAFFLGSADSMGTDIDVYVGDGSTFFHIYGLQCEQGSYPTSYIPTYGVSQTRLADVCNGAGDASTFNDSEGVFYAEISTNTDNTDKALSINNSLSGGSNSRLWMGYSTTAKRVYALGYVNNSLQFALSKLMTDESVFVKIACKYALNDVSFFVNGEKVGTDTSALEFIGLNSLDFNIGTGTGGAVFFGNAKQVLYFPTALSDSECIALTTI